MYAVFEHSFRVREGDEQRVWLSLPAAVAPVSCSVLPLSGNDKFDPFITAIGTSQRHHQELVSLSKLMLVESDSCWTVARFGSRVRPLLAESRTELCSSH